MPRKDEKRLRIGVLGCGPIAQATHFESCADPRERMAATFAPEKSYADYGRMLAARIAMPTLVIGYRQDLAHPLAYAERLASLFPRAELRLVTPKARNREEPRREFGECLADFLGRLT
jgi:pimeloyl-ACP methyl ester carboxylesterase